MFELFETKDQMLDVEDLIGGARFAVHERRKPLGMTAGDLFEARLVWDGATVVFGRTFLFHPPDARDVVLEWVERASRPASGATRSCSTCRASTYAGTGRGTSGPPRSIGMREAARPAVPPRRRRWARWLLGIALAGLAFVVAANLYLIARASAATLPGVEPAPARPYAIVLGNRVSPDGTPSRELATRLETALALHRAGRAGKVMVSGACRRRLRRAARDGGVARGAWGSAGDIVVDEGGHRTAATMADAAALGVRSAHVVTQGYHLPRALHFARHAGIDALGVPAPPWRSGLAAVRVRVFFRECTARAEALLEVTFRGVH